MSGIKKICKKIKIGLPKNIKIENPFWYASKGGKIGNIVAYKKYGRIGGDPEYTKKRWHEWWEREGKFKSKIIKKCKPIIKPKFSKELAEFVGVILGDGGITSRQITVTLNKFDDKDFSIYVSDLFKKLFEVNVSAYERESVINIVASRVELVKFLTRIGLKVGGKVRQQVGVPNWINESKIFIKSCLRGLLDTDGCFYIDKHKYKDKIYLNCGVNFTNRSLPILNFFRDNLVKLGYHPTQKTEFSIFLRREEEIVRYFKEIGSSNPKHLNKFIKYFKNKFGEVPKWT